MKEWLSDAIEQIVLGDILANSNISFGRRFALIAIDNSVEYALICYVEVYKRLVGGHIAGGIPKNDWEKKKNHFDDLLTCVVSIEPKLATHKDDISRFHGIRNDLYHTGTPLTVNESTVASYSRIAKEALNILFSLNFDDNEWINYTGKVKDIFSNRTDTIATKDIVVFERMNGVIKYTTTLVPKTPTAILLIIHGYSLLEGREPSQDELVTSLKLSGISTSRAVSASRVAEMRAKGLIHSGKLALKEKGRKALSDKYNLRIQE